MSTTIGDVRRDLEEARDRRERRLAGHVEVQHHHARTQLPGRAQRALDVAGLGHDREARLGVEHHPQPAADHRVVVREDDLDPAPGELVRIRHGGATLPSREAAGQLSLTTAYWMRSATSTTVSPMREQRR